MATASLFRELPAVGDPLASGTAAAHPWHTPHRGMAGRQEPERPEVTRAEGGDSDGSSTPCDTGPHSTRVDGVLGCLPARRL